MSDTTNPTPEDEQQVPESLEQDAAVEASGVTIESLTGQLVAAQTELSRRGQGLRKSTNITVGIGVVLIGAMVWYFGYGLSEINELADPDNLISRVQIGIQEMGKQEQNPLFNKYPHDLDSAVLWLNRKHYPTNVGKLQEWLDKQIAENGPVIAKQFSDQAVKSADAVRFVVENYAVEQMEILVDQGTDFTAEKFKQMVDENRLTIENAMKDLEENPELSKATIDELIGMLETELGTDIQDQAGLVLGTLKALNAKLERLAKADDLNAEEQAEKAALMIARQLLVEQAAVTAGQ